MKDGEPLSWRHYTAGLRHLSMYRAQESLRQAGAVGAAQMKEEDRKDWFRRQTIAAGW